MKSTIYYYYKLPVNQMHSGVQITIFCLLFIFFPSFVHTQSLKLYNVNIALSRSIISTRKVSILTYDQDTDKIKGELSIVNDSTIRIDSLHISLSDIASIKVISNKSRMWGYIFAAASALSLGTGILILSTSGGDAGLYQLGNTIFGVQFILQGAAASIPAIRFFFYGKTYKKISGWELRIQRPL